MLPASEPWLGCRCAVPAAKALAGEVALLCCTNSAEQSEAFKNSQHPDRSVGKVHIANHLLPSNY